jgi:hypothetical protein
MRRWLRERVSIGTSMRGLRRWEDEPQMTYVSLAKAYMYQPANSLPLVGRVSSPGYLGGGGSSPSSCPPRQGILPLLELPLLPFSMSKSSSERRLVLERSSSASKSLPWERKEAFVEALERKRAGGAGRAIGGSGGLGFLGAICPCLVSRVHPPRLLVGRTGAPWPYADRAGTSPGQSHRPDTSGDGHDDGNDAGRLVSLRMVGMGALLANPSRGLLTGDMTPLYDGGSQAVGQLPGRRGLVAGQMQSAAE